MKTALDSKVDIPAILAGITYGGGMFMAGFVMGAIRQIFLAPLVGDLLAVIFEIPFMLVICWYLSKQCLLSWYLCKCCLLWKEECTNVNTIGITSFLTLLLLETVLSMTLFNRSLDEIQEGFATTNGRIGLVAQLLAATFPSLQLPREDDDFLM